ncbi:MAG: family 10 glycosylhydrolase [Lentisphaeria bacterium]|nr:family 10 glycosylhydrolase [Lentisphaeria bacterium]
MNFRKSIFTMALIGSALASFGEGIIQNEDNTHYFVIGKIGSTEQDLRQHIDNYLYPGHQMTDFMLNPGAYLFSAKIGDLPAAWENLTFNADGSITGKDGKVIDKVLWPRYKVMKKLHEDGIDPYKIWIDQLRKRGVRPWISWRTNDIHNPFNTWEVSYSDFWAAHPEWRTGVFPNYTNWQATAMDYSIPEVREHVMHIIFTLIDTYDIDGFELDFMRFGEAFRHGKEITEGHKIMLEMLREIRKHLDEKAAKEGRDRIKLGLRLAADPRDAWRLGFDVETYAKEGLIDLVTAATVFHTTWHDVPVREWKKLCGDNVEFAVCIESNKRSHWYFLQSSYADPGDVANGLAASYLHQGADKIYLFNTFWYPKDIMTTSGKLETIVKAPRRCPILYNDLRSVGAHVYSQLPQKFAEKYTRPYRINIGPNLQDGDKAYVVMAFKDNKVPRGDFADVYVNSNKPIKRSNFVPELFFREELNAGVVAFEIPNGYLHEGENIIEVSANGKQQWTLDWIEIYIANEKAMLQDENLIALNEAFANVQEWQYNYNAVNGNMPGNIYNPGSKKWKLVKVNGRQALRFDCTGTGSNGIASLSKPAEIAKLGNKIAIELEFSIPEAGSDLQGPWNWYFAFANGGDKKANFSMIVGRNKISSSFGNFAFPTMTFDVPKKLRMLVDAEAGTITMQLGNGKVQKFNLKNDLNRTNYLGFGDAGNSTGRNFDLYSMKIGRVE